MRTVISDAPEAAPRRFLLLFGEAVSKQALRPGAHRRSSVRARMASGQGAERISDRRLWQLPALAAASPVAAV